MQSARECKNRRAANDKLGVITLGRMLKMMDYREQDGPLTTAGHTQTVTVLKLVSLTYAIVK
jgi:hypothetical protein